MRYAMIMAGGSGTRLWPMSRKDRPKQLLPLVEGKSLLQVAADRLRGLIPEQQRYICALERYRTMIRESVPSMSDEQILGEPEGRDTVNAIGLTAAVLAKNDADAIFAVLTADHIIEPVDEFQRKLKQGFELVESNAHRMVTFSILPNHPATGYGYIERGESISGFSGAYVVQSFQEKPDEGTARQYLATDRHFWNSGMFIFSAQTYLDALQRFKAQSYEGLMRIAEAWGTGDQQSVLQQEYPQLPKISVDYAIMEPAARDADITVCTVPMGIWWMDIGSWPSYGETLKGDSRDNHANTKVTHVNSRNVLAVSDDPNHTIATVDCENLIIVHTKDATMVCPADSAERVKDLASEMDESLC